MHIDIAPETERLVREKIRADVFRSVDELIKAGVEALREKNAQKSLVRLFRDKTAFRSHLLTPWLPFGMSTHRSEPRL
jgi:Arc/MetJ-type ribon-helix-helix transcriptional regulator